MKSSLLNRLTIQSWKGYGVEQVEEESVSNHGSKPNPIPLSFRKDTAGFKHGNSKGLVLSRNNLYNANKCWIFYVYAVVGLISCQERGYLLRSNWAPEIRLLK